MAIKKQQKKTSDFRDVEFRTKIEYAKVHEADTQFNPKGEFSVTLVLDTKERQEAFRKLMHEHSISSTVFNPKTKKIQDRLSNKKEGGLRIQIKRPKTNAKGVVAELPVVDAKCRPIPKNVLIGNGSEAIVKMFTYPLKDKDGEVTILEETGEPERAIRLSGIQVVNLVQFNKNGLSFKEVEGGFEVDSTAEFTVIDDEEANDDDTSPF